MCTSLLIQAYKQGNWLRAKAMLENCLMAREDWRGNAMRDVPSEVLLGYMKEHGYQAPASWM